MPLREVVSRKDVDQVVFIFFDTSIKNSEDYKIGMEQQLMHIKKVRELKPGRKTQYQLAFGTFVNEAELHKYRDLKVEDLGASSLLHKSLLASQFKDDRIVDGYSIYCDWETDAEDWRIIREQWPRPR